MQKFIIKTDMPEMKDILQFVGFQVENNKFVIPEDSELEIVNYLERAIDRIPDAQELPMREPVVIPFEDEMAYMSDTEEFSKEDSYVEEGPKMVKKLGEMPSSNNNHGFSNSVSLILFLAIDLIAIGVGLLFLMN